MNPLTTRLAPNQRAKPQDILNIKTVLNDLDYYNRPSIPITPYVDNDLFDGIKNFQRDHDLKVDGVMNPNGETERALRLKVAQLDTKSKDYQDFIKTHKRTKTHEGGIANRPAHEDPGGITHEGTSQLLLNLVKKKNPNENLADKTTELSKNKRTEISKREFWDILRMDKVKAISNLEKESKNLADQIYDTGFQSGPTTSGQLLQKSLDEILGTDLRTDKFKTGLDQYDGDIGPKTRAAIQKAVDEKKAKKVNNTMVDNRKDYYEGLSNYSFNRGGWISRVESYREE